MRAAASALRISRSIGLKERAQPGFEGISLTGHRVDLGAEQLVGAPQFLMPHQQALNALGDLIELGLGQHSPNIVGFAAGVG